MRKHCLIQWGASVITIKRDLYILRDLGLIKYLGNNKTGHLEVIG